MAINPFRFGDLVADEAFTNREDEIRELTADALNGQNVVIFAPRRYGKTSLMKRVAADLRAQDVLVAQVDLMKTPTKEKLAEHLTRTIYSDLATRLYKATDAAKFVTRLRIRPTMTVDPSDGTFQFSYESGRKASDIDATIEALLELPGQFAAERKRRVVVILDEFQEIMDIDPKLPGLMRAVFQEQAQVAHFYLGSKRHMMERIFNDQNEPFWKSAKSVELDVIPDDKFRLFIRERFASTGRDIPVVIVDLVLNTTRCHPHATQQLCYFLWQLVAYGESASIEAFNAALDAVLRSQHAHFERIWEKAAATQQLVLNALAREPGRPLAEAYRKTHSLPGTSTVQAAVTALTEDELIRRGKDNVYEVAEPFLAEWLIKYGA